MYFMRRITQCFIKHNALCDRKSTSYQFVAFLHRMSDRKQVDHMARTADNTRDPGNSAAVVAEITDLSPTVKGLRLQLENHEVRFKAGQWVDFIIPGLATVGGFSMSSSPELLVARRAMQLAVKYSKHPPAHWVHTQIRVAAADFRVDFMIPGVSIFTGYSMCSSPLQMERRGTLDLAVKATDYAPTFWVHNKCQAGSEVTVQVGGDFYYDPQPDAAPSNLLLVAGGVGINPMLSMMHHASDLHKKHASGENVHKPGKVLMLYSAPLQQELIFKEQIKSLCEHQDINCWYYVTQEPVTQGNNISNHRISQSSIAAALESLSCSIEDVACYICGPGPMIDTMEEYLTNSGLSKDRIHYEKWW